MEELGVVHYVYTKLFSSAAPGTTLDLDPDPAWKFEQKTSNGQITKRETFVCLFYLVKLTLKLSTKHKIPRKH